MHAMHDSEWCVLMQCHLSNGQRILICGKSAVITDKCFKYLQNFYIQPVPPFWLQSLESTSLFSYCEISVDGVVISQSAQRHISLYSTSVQYFQCHQQLPVALLDNIFS